MLQSRLRIGSLIALISFAFLHSSKPANADVRLPSVFSDHMVLQREQVVPVWGWAEPGEKVQVQFGDHKTTGVANDAGRWQVELPAMDANAKSQTLQVQGNNRLEVKDVLVGEVWLCSGQSNMEWTVASSNNAAEELAVADHPLIRHIQFPKTPEFLPRQDVPAKWQVCSPQTVGQFTAAGYFMARELNRELNVPIGLLNSSWGGTRVEPWTPPVGFERVDALKEIYQSIVGRTPGTDAYNDRLTQYIDADEQWIRTAKEAQADKSLLQPSPAYPAELLPFQSHQDPTMLYNGMIYPILGYGIRGAIWYQGESNHDEGMLYFEKKKALIEGWREVWNQGDFPFYFVQIAPYQYGNEDPAILAEFWEAQAAVQQIPNTGMVVINDVGNVNDIHPRAKQEVGQRLAGLALKYDYGRKDLVADSPEMQSMEIVGDQLRIVFKNAGGGLKSRDGNPPSHFQLIGVGSKGFQAATAKIDGDAVILTAQGVTNPTAFRFAWNKTAEPNLMGGTGLPVGAFRGGEVPKFVDTLPISEDHRLVYDLDLSKLAGEIKYDVDNSDQIEAFDRIAYLVELTPLNGEPQVMYVCVDAFTDDAKRIGIPTLASKADFRQSVGAMDVSSNVQGIVSGTGIATGNIEFWPDNYAAGNGGQVKGADDRVYDFGDDPGPPVDGYGSMQIHNYGGKQTLFSINHWKEGAKADLGIGNSVGNTRDWTFTGNADSYKSKRLRVYVK